MKQIAILLSVAALASGCSVIGPTFGAGGKCVTNSDCNAPLTCVANICAGTTTNGSSGGAGGTSRSGSSAIRFVNASPATAALQRDTPPIALDLCVKLDRDATYGAAGQSGSGETYGAASDLLAAPAALVDVRVIAAGSDCSDSSSLFDLPAPLDMSDGGTFTIVAYGDSQTVVSGVVSSETTAPTPATDAHVSVIHVLADEGTVNVTVPASPLAPALGVGSAASADVAPLVGDTVTVSETDNLVGHTFAFANISVAAAAQVTLIVLGDTIGEIAPQILICDDTAATNGCTGSTASAQAFVRLADLAAGADLSGNPPGVTLCARDHGTTAYSAIATATYGGAFKSITGFSARVVATASVDFAVVPATGTVGALIASACDAAAVGNAFATSTETLAASSYNTLAFTSTAAAHLTKVVTQPTSTGGAVVLTVFNGSSSDGDDFGPVTVTVPELFGKTLSASLASSAAAVVTVSSTSQLSSRLLRFTAADQSRVEATITVPAALTAASVWLAGDNVGASSGSVIVCADDGSVDTAGDSACTTFPATAADASVPNGFLRVANFAASQGAAIDVCTGLDAGSVPLFSNVAVGTVSAFDGATELATIANLYVLPHATASPCAQTNPVHVDLALADPNYYTLFVDDDPTTEIFAKEQTPPTPSAGDFSLNVTNDWSGSGTDIFTVDAAPAGAVAVLIDAVPSNTYNPFPITAAHLTVKSNALATGTTFTFDLANASPRDGGVYEAIALSASATAPKILWCDDEQVVGATTACVAITHD